MYVDSHGNGAVRDAHVRTIHVQLRCWDSDYLDLCRPLQSYDFIFLGHCVVFVTFINPNI